MFSKGHHQQVTPVGAGRDSLAVLGTAMVGARKLFKFKVVFSTLVVVSEVTQDTSKSMKSRLAMTLGVPRNKILADSKKYFFLLFLDHMSSPQDFCLIRLSQKFIF